MLEVQDSSAAVRYSALRHDALPAISGPVDPLLTTTFHPFIGTDRRRQPNVMLRARGYRGKFRKAAACV